MLQSICLAQVDFRSAPRRTRAQLLLAVVALFAVAGTCTAPMAALRSEQSKSPFEAEEECQQKLEEGLFNSQRRFRSGSKRRHSPANLRQADRLPSLVLSRPSRSVEGHRLPNGALAPMTC